MRAIGAGWGRTGTTSAAAALDLLGFGPCVQMQAMWEQPALAETWAAHDRGEPTDWLAVLGEFGATVDWPGCWEWRTFARLWPEAKVLRGTGCAGAPRLPTRAPRRVARL